MSDFDPEFSVKEDVCVLYSAYISTWSPDHNTKFMKLYKFVL